jgi:hypothetical protein
MPNGTSSGFLRRPIGGHSEIEVITVHREPFVLVVPSSQSGRIPDAVAHLLRGEKILLEIPKLN